MSSSTTGPQTPLIDQSQWAGIEPNVTTDRIPPFSALNTQGQTFVDNGGSFESTFGVSEAAFRVRWIQYLKAHYPRPALLHGS